MSVFSSVHGVWGKSQRLSKFLIISPEICVNLTHFSENIYYSVIPSAADFYTAYFVLFFRVLLVYNIVVTLLPLIRKQDTFSDIPLTPSQRSLLGLNPNDTPPAPPGAKYITPPRYPRSSTPRSFGTPGSNRSDSKSTSGSPLSRNGSPSLGQQSRNLSGSPSASPLWQRVVGGGPRDSLRRNSYGSASPLGPGFVEPKGGSVFGAPATPSPTTRRDASVGLSSRWLYERGKASPGRNFL